EAARRAASRLSPGREHRSRRVRRAAGECRGDDPRGGRGDVRGQAARQGSRRLVGGTPAGCERAGAALRRDPPPRECRRHRGGRLCCAAFFAPRWRTQGMPLALSLLLALVAAPQRSVPARSAPAAGATAKAFPFATEVHTLPNALWRVRMPYGSPGLVAYYTLERLRGINR